MLLTRSPLSPGPKPRFSLDLHVLGAPPAFVLSQDQTLREELVCRRTGKPFTSSLKLTFELVCSKVVSEDTTRLNRFPHGTAEAVPIGSRRKRTLLSFQRPRHLLRRREKASTRAEAPGC